MQFRVNSKVDISVLMYSDLYLTERRSLSVSEDLSLNKRKGMNNE